ncbi:MAG: cation transporter, partial [Alphaproteobacteria bacterium]|nr:cation transporter [Alphaproteobacteria bacterium]
KIVNILMNAAPDNIDIGQIKKFISEIDDVKDVHHIHLWSISEHNVALECHIESCNVDIVSIVADKLKDKFGIDHCNIQIETTSCGKCCDL